MGVGACLQPICVIMRHGHRLENESEETTVWYLYIKCSMSPEALGYSRKLISNLVQSSFIKLFSHSSLFDIVLTEEPSIQTPHHGCDSSSGISRHDRRRHPGSGTREQHLRVFDDCQNRIITGSHANTTANNIIIVSYSLATTKLS